ncbi:hypothetical protein PL263_10500 [Methylomonas sp. EFPC3]|uniref:hypothetical protein n=1 Tax=Methylomonas sp. EFPC3 TaxID=3021710 RepID=UPI00241645B8|nr:hypothetical protein [Methylomonas sp. EFPC3]WFP48543.1 hypothetical protein PL263_10500 [Methylomonas sp. EFPC3]
MPTKVERYQPMISPTSLDEDTQRQLWYGLQSLDPGVAALIKDENNPFNADKRAFSATIVFPRDRAREYVREGRRILEERARVRQNDQVLQDQ